MGSVGGGLRRGLPTGHGEGLTLAAVQVTQKEQFGNTPPLYWVTGALIPEETLADTIQILTDANWDADVMKSQEPVLVDFWADWCAPCKTLMPAVEAVAEQFKGRLRVGKVNVEENEHVPFQYNITTLPTLLIIKGGKVSEQRVGLISRDNLVKLIEPHLG